jgi:hypothetical protein
MHKAAQTRATDSDGVAKDANYEMRAFYIIKQGPQYWKTGRDGINGQKPGAASLSEDFPTYCCSILL